jgi:exodeoxyribonuclease V alpha subunit
VTTTLETHTLSSEPSHEIVLSGTIERIRFHNEESGFCVLMVKVNKQPDLVAVTARAAMIGVGEYVECQGQWHDDKRHGRQFKASQLRIVPPQTVEGIEKYLASGMVKGIGAHFAKQLVQAFAEKVFDVIEYEPERLENLPGIGPKRRKQVVNAFAEQKVVREIMVFLQSHGMGTALSFRIYKAYGDNAVTRVQNNPYNLAKDIRGIGFKTADELAQSLGIAPDSVLRAQAGIRHLLQTYANNGHCAVKHDELIKATAELLVIDKAIVQQGLADEITAETVIAQSIHNEPCIFLAPLFQAEKSVATHMVRLLHGKIPWAGIDIPKALPWVEQKTGLQLSPSQEAAIKTVLSSKVAIITGGPGVGKTTVVNSILRIIRTKGLQVILCAPTGRAAKRLSESTELSAKTIHRLLEFDGKGFSFKRDENNPLVADLLVLDEASMVDVVLMSQLLRAIPQHAGLLIVGDVDQLPSVGPGMVLADLIESTIIPTARLNEIFRQAANSNIIFNAHRVNQGEIPVAAEKTEDISDFYFIAAKNPDDIHAKLLQLVTERIPARFGYDPISDIQVLTPMNRGNLGTLALNTELQNALNPHVEPRIQRYGITLAVGDKVIQTVNNYDKDIYNGDIGRISRINLDEKTVTVDYEERIIDYDWNDCDEITLAYAITIHKSQGSEYPVVVMPLSTQHYTLLQRNLVYTGMTRGKRLVVLVAEPKALAMAVNNHQAHARLTSLKERLTSWD